VERKKVDLDLMRADYRLVRKWWMERDGWLAADLAEADMAVKAAVEGGDEEMIACWADWLAVIAAGIRERGDA